jgi:hypothetical protein
MRSKKVSGRWGFRPLGRGDGGKRNPKLFLTSRHYAALASSTTAHRSSVNRPGSRDQLPITLRLCFAAVRRSIVPSFHFIRYFPPNASVPFHRYLGTVGPHNRVWQSPESRFARLYTPNFSPTFELRLYSGTPEESALAGRSEKALGARHFPPRYVILPSHA